MLRQYGLDHRSAMKIAQSRKKYWRLSNTHEVHRALTTKQLYKWGLIPLAQLYGLDHRSAMKIAQSRKKYWRLSNTHEVHRALTTKQLYKWGLIPLAQLAELAYARY